MKVKEGVLVEFGSHNTFYRFGHNLKTIDERWVECLLTGIPEFRIQNHVSYWK